MTDESKTDEAEDAKAEDAKADDAKADDAEADVAEAEVAEGGASEGAADDDLDLDRGELSDDDLDILETAIGSVDFATRRATSERLQRLTSLQDRLGDVVEQIRAGKRRQQERSEPTEADLDRAQQLVDEGISAGEKGDLDQAMKTLEEAVRLDPDGIDALFNLGVVYGLLAHKNIAKAEFYDDYTRDEVFTEKARICYDRVLEQDAEHLPSLNNLATLASMRDNREEAMRILQQIVGIAPKGPDDQAIVAAAREQLADIDSI